MDDASKVVVQPVGKVLLVPVQGPVSPELFELLGRTLLHQLADQGAQAIVLDLRGVEVMDSHDLLHLKKVVDSVVLMGARVVVAELQPGVAAGLASLDVDGSWIEATRTVERAMERLGRWRSEE